MRKPINEQLRYNRTVSPSEWRWVRLISVGALLIVSTPYLLAWKCQTSEWLFSGCILLDEDCHSYLAKMRQGAEGAWLFHIAYTSEPHPGTLFFPFHLLFGKVAALLPSGDLTARMVWVYHGARVVFGLMLLLTVYCFLAAFTERVLVRRVAWLMVTFGGGLGWVLVMLGQTNWLGTPPLDFYLPEGFAFLVVYGFPHTALAQSLLLWGILFSLKAWEAHPRSEVRSPESEVQRPKSGLRLTCHVSRIASVRWAALAGLLWLAMGLIVPFYVPVAWAVMGAAWLVLGLRRRRVLFREGLLAAVTVLVSMPIIVYSAWVFTTDRVYATWGAQNLILSPHPLHYLAAYGVPVMLAAFAVKDAWRDEGPVWLALAWVGVVPVLVYLPFNLQRRLLEGVQVPLSLLAAWGAVRLWRARRRPLVVALLVTMLPTSLILLAGSSAWMFDRPAPMFRNAAEVAALDWLAGRAQADDVILSAYETGTYLPARVVARVFLGHGFETVDADGKERLVGRFFDAATGDAWRQQLLAEYGVDAVFWGPVEQALGTFDPHAAPYLRRVYEAEGYAIFEVER